MTPLRLILAISSILILVPISTSAQNKQERPRYYFCSENQLQGASNNAGNYRVEVPGIQRAKIDEIRSRKAFIKKFGKTLAKKISPDFDFSRYKLVYFHPVAPKDFETLELFTPTPLIEEPDSTVQHILSENYGISNIFVEYFIPSRKKFPNEYYDGPCFVTASRRRRAFAVLSKVYEPSLQNACISGAPGSKSSPTCFEKIDKDLAQKHKTLTIFAFPKKTKIYGVETILAHLPASGNHIAIPKAPREE